jgi:hypothetical protein
VCKEIVRTCLYRVAFSQRNRRLVHCVRNTPQSASIVGLRARKHSPMSLHLW